MNNKRVINSNTTFLKIIAIISMTLDEAVKNLVSLESESF